MRLLSSLKCILTLLLSIPATAQWSEQSISYVNNYNSANHKRELADWTDDYLRAIVEHLNLVSSIEDSDFQTRLAPIQVNLDEKTFMLPETDTRGDYLDSNFFTQKGSSDLVVIIPGLFQGRSDKLVLHIAKQLIDLGYHVLAFPSPFSKEYIARYPLKSVGSYKEEALMYLNAIENFKNFFADRVQNVHLVGISYGAFVSSVLLAHDKNSLISGQTTLLGPQVKLKTTLALLDDSIDYRNSLLAPFKGKVGEIFYYDTLYFTINLVERYQYHKERDFKHREYSQTAVDSFEEIPADLRDVTLEIIGQRAQPQLEKWKNSARFWNTVVKYTPENRFYYDEGKDQIGYWLSIAKEGGNDKVRLVTAKDDFTNVFDDWFKHGMMPIWLLDEKHFLIRENGSHISYTATNWFSEFLKTAFPKMNPRQLTP